MGWFFGKRSAPIAWQEEVVAGHSVRWFAPPTRHEHGYTLLYLHDIAPASTHPSDAYVRLCQQHGVPVVAPVTGQSWWADHRLPSFDHQITPMRYVLDHIMPWIEHKIGTSPPRIGLLGVGMGGQGALRLAYLHPNTFPVVAGVAPDLDYHFRIREGDEVLYAMYGDMESARQDAAILHIHPLNWPRHQFFCGDPADQRILDGVDRLRMKLSSIGIPFEFDMQSSAARGKSYGDTMAPRVIEYLLEKLDRERLRV